MKNFILLFAALCTTAVMVAQDLPTNPEPGKCYVRCTTPDVYVNETMRIMTKPAYKRLSTVPAQYETVTERIMIKEAEKRLRVVPATWGTETITYAKRQSGGGLNITPASFTSDTETIEIKPAYAQWELGAPAPDCDSSNPDDCRYWCYKGYPAEFATIKVSRLANDATTSRNRTSEQAGTYTKRVVATPSRVEEVVIPAEYATIKKTVLVKEASVAEKTVPAEYRTVTKEVLKTKGGLTTWREVECALVEYQALPINWNLGSATLTQQARNLIDTRLMPVLAQNPGVKLEIASHTDSRGSNTSNQDLSERRAQAVVAYLQSKGVNPSLLVANGYGERRLLNRCKDGVSCTEREHRANRRTQFRLINN